MRWAALFEDLEGQLAAAEQLDLASEVSERARMDQAAISLADRLRGQIGCLLRARVQADETFDGRLVHVGSEWLVLEAGPRSVLIPMAATMAFRGLGRSTSMEQSFSENKLKLTSALRALSRDRTLLSVHMKESGREGAATGTIDRVGNDFIEVAVVPSGEYRRARNVSEVVTVPLHAIGAIVSQ